MKTKDLLELVYTEPEHGFQTKLAYIADRLVAEREAREDARYAEAQARDALAGQGPMLDVLQRELAAAQHAQLTQSPLPACMTFDAYGIMKDASRTDPSDRGLKMAAHALYERWSEDPLGHLSVGELVSYRDYFSDMFPKSAVRQVFDLQVPNAGFQQLANLPYLTRLAADVVDQQTYEHVCEAARLDGDRPEQIRSRAYIKALAELTLSDEAFEHKPPTVQDAINRALARYAQEEPLNHDLDLGQEDDEGSEDDLDLGLEGPIHAPGEEELPHDEMSEEMTTIESPVSGEELVLELGLPEEEGEMDFEPGLESEQSSPAPGALPSQFNAQAQLMDGSSVEIMDADQSGDLESQPGEDEGLFEDTHPTGGEESVATVVDPSSGQELEVILRPKSPESAGPSMEPGAEGMQPMASRVAKAPPGREKQVKELKKDKDIDNPWAVAWSSYNKGKKKSKKKGEQSGASALSPGVSGQPGDAVPGMSTDRLKEKDSHGSEESKSDDKASKTSGLSVAQVQKICAGLGLATSDIERVLLDGDWAFGGRELVAGVREWGIGIDNGDNIVIAAYAPTGDVTRIVRQAGLVQFDDVVRDFQALVAASQVTLQARAAATAAKGPKTQDYLITTDVPGGGTINARRMMAQVWQVSPEAEGEQLDDGRLSILVRQAEEKAINRIARVLTDTFGVAQFEAKKVKVAQLAPGTPQNSPFVGAPPVVQQPAGTPALQMQTGMQTSAVGTGTQQQFIQQHTDPLKRAEAEACKTCGATEAGCEHRVAQLDEGGDEGLDEGLDEAAGPAAPLPMGPPGMSGMMPGMGGGMPGMMPGMGPGAGMSMPGGPGAGAMDASQMPLNMATGQLTPEDEEAMRSAMVFFRNTGESPLQALAEFTSKFKGLLERYGDERSPERSSAEAAVIRGMTEAYSRPAVISVSAEMKTPKVLTQHPGLSVSKDFPEGDLKLPGKPKTQTGPAQGSYSDTSLAQGDDSSHGFANVEPGEPQRGSKTKGKGTSFSNTNMDVGTNGENTFTRHLDQKSREAPSAMRSKKKGDLVISLDDDVGLFDLRRQGKDKPLALHASLSDALADAERRRYGTEAKILIDNGDGTFDEF